MTLNLEDPEIDGLAHEVAQLEGSTVAEAVGRALKERRAELLRREEIDRKVRQIQAEVAALPVLDPRDHGEMLYDEDGLPR